MNEVFFPGTFARAILSSNVILPGSRLLLRGGTYTGDFFSTIHGTAKAPITIQSYPGEHAILDGSLIVFSSAHTIWKDLEIRYSGWLTRSTAKAGSSPADIPATKRVQIIAQGCKFINCVIHDMADNGFDFWSASVDSELYGCVIYNIGWSGPDRGHGHLFYTQNETGTKHIRDCIAFNSFSTGLKIYTEGGHAQGYNVVGNTIFNSAVLYAGNDYGMNFWVQDPNPGTGYTFDSNMSYHAKPTGDPVRIGLYDYQYGVRLLNNYWPEGIIKNCELLEERGNYYGPALGNRVFLRANDYDPNRANLTIYNEAEASTIDIDISALFGQTGTVKAHNAQDYFTDIQTLTITAGVITVSMINRTVAAPVGWTAPATTFPQFGAFVLERTT